MEASTSPMRSEYTIKRAVWEEDSPALCSVREAVFIREQKVPKELEWDEHDISARHLLALDGSGRAIGAARLLPEGRIGRMCVLAEHRGRGVGAALLRAALEWAMECGMERIVLDAQTHAVDFYGRFGFEADGPVFMDAGIAHRHMSLKL